MPNSACSHELIDFFRLLYDVSKLYIGMTHPPTYTPKVLPKCIREAFPTGLPEDASGRPFFDTVVDKTDQLKDPSFGEFLFTRHGGVRSDKEILARLRHGGLAQMVQDSLSENQHWTHASTRSGNNRSIESPHNSIHMFVGYPMSSPETITTCAFASRITN